MDPEIFSDLLSSSYISPRTFANMTGRKHGQVWHWKKGHRPIPDEVADWLRKFNHFMEHNPPPQKKKNEEQNSSCI